MKNVLKEHGLKATPARIEILEIFRKSELPLDAEAVFKKVSAKGGSASGGKKINEVTVYRTLASLEEKGILKKVDLRKDSVYFELAKEHHHHIICTSCERIEDFENKKLEKFLEKIKSSKFKSIKDHALELFGLCRVCA